MPFFDLELRRQRQPVESGTLANNKRTIKARWLIIHGSCSHWENFLDTKMSETLSDDLLFPLDGRHHCPDLLLTDCAATDRSDDRRIWPKLPRNK